MRRLLGVLLLSSSLMLVAVAAPAAPSPSPSPSSGPSAAPVLPPATGATVLVYPFDVQTGVDKKIGLAIASILAQEMAAAGGLTVLPVPQGVKRADFLQNAHSQSADYYISGYVTPVGDSAAVVEQVVSVDSGVILFSQTAQVQSVADVASQSLQARAQILAFVNRATQNIAAQSSSTPAPTATNGANMQIKGLSGIVDSVFHHRGAATPAPTPGVKPERGVIVSPVTAANGISSTDGVNATHELFFSMQHAYRVTMTQTGNVASSADAICGTDRNNTIAAGALTQQAPAAHGRPETVFTLSIYTCFGAVLAQTVGKGGSYKQAVDAAVAAYITAHPQNN